VAWSKWLKIALGAAAAGGVAYAWKKRSDQGESEDQAEAGGESETTPGTKMPDLNTSDVDHLQLIEPARSMALAVKAAFPTIIFTSGRRSRFSTAKAITEDGRRVATARGISHLAGTVAYVTETYKETAAKDALLAALNALPDTDDWMTVQNAILAEINGWSDAFLGLLSRHPGGLAFDMHVDPKIDVTQLRATLAAQPGFDKFLDHEAGEAIWHAQAVPPSAPAVA